MSQIRVDLNADVGESFGVYVLGRDSALMPHVTSASVACGFHAGDPSVMRETVALALQHGVSIGAHPGFPDLAGFGRRALGASPREIEDMVVYQIGAIGGIAAALGARVRHVKPHGALYNLAADDAAIAAAIARAIRAVDASLVLVGLSGSCLVRAGRDAGLATASEAFADRGYGADGRLLPRGEPGALLHDPATVAARAVAMVRQGAVTCNSGASLPIDVDTLCVHGDTPDAAAIARAVRGALLEAGVDVRSIAAP